MTDSLADIAVRKACYSAHIKMTIALEKMIVEHYSDIPN